jgi:hypothetical protein
MNEHGCTAGAGYLLDGFLAAAVMDIGYHYPGSLACHVPRNTAPDT